MSPSMVSNVIFRVGCPRQTIAIVGVLRTRLALLGLLLWSPWLSLAVACTQSPDSGSGTNNQTAAKGPVLTAEVQQTLDAFTAAAYDCPERVLPGYDWRSLQVLVVDLTSTHAVLWNDLSKPATETPAVSFVPMTEVPPQLTGVYGYDVFKGHPTLSILHDFWAALPSNVLTYPVRLAFHEGFHFHGQANWAVTDVSIRDPEYPEDWRPRYLRAQIHRCLETALFEQDMNALGEAAFWQARYSTEHRADGSGAAALDMIEGTAQYVEMRATLVAALGCDVPEETLDEHMRSDADAFLLGGQFDKGAEYYELGVLAGALLNQKDPGGAWLSAVARGVTPVALLVEGVPPISARDDEVLVGGARYLTQERNEEGAQIIEPLLQELAAAGTTRIAVPWSWSVGAFEYQGGFQLVNEPGRPLVMYGVGGVFTAPNGASVVLEDAIILSYINNPCALDPQDTFLVAMPTDALASDDGVYLWDAPHTRGSAFAATPLLDADVSWLCPEL
jgi:hypothetical protein